MPMPEIDAAVSYLGSESDREELQRYGPTICPDSPRIRDDLDFEITQVSDCAVVSTEVSVAGAIAILNHCFIAVFRLMTAGLMCRGHIRRGQIYHSGSRIIGTGYQDAVVAEKAVSIFKREENERGTPFVEVDSSLTEFIRRNGDQCALKVLPRFIRESDGLAAVFPFKRLENGSSIGPQFDPEEQISQHEIMRNNIRKLLDQIPKYVDRGHEDAVRKSGHYIRALERELARCDQADQDIDFLCQPYPAQ